MPDDAALFSPGPLGARFFVCTRTVYDCTIQVRSRLSGTGAGQGVSFRRATKRPKGTECDAPLKWHGACLNRRGSFKTTEDKKGGIFR